MQYYQLKKLNSQVRGMRYYNYLNIRSNMCVFFRKQWAQLSILSPTIFNEFPLHLLDCWHDTKYMAGDAGL